VGRAHDWTCMHARNAFTRTYGCSGVHTCMPSNTHTRRCMNVHAHARAYTHARPHLSYRKAASSRCPGPWKPWPRCSMNAALEAAVLSPCSATSRYCTSAPHSSPARVCHHKCACAPSQMRACAITNAREAHALVIHSSALRSMLF